MRVSPPWNVLTSFASIRAPLRAALGWAGVIVFAGACDAEPRDRHIQWVARDAWNPLCADKAIVERWVQSNGSWKVQGKVWQVDVDATFKMGNDCEGQGETPAIPAYQSVNFMRPALEMVPCRKGGEDGWALPGQENDRCWTSPKLLDAP